MLKRPLGSSYFAGDTGYGSGEHFKAGGAHTVAYALAIDLRADDVLGYHWATSRMTNETINEPVQRFSAVDKLRANLAVAPTPS